MNTHTQAIQLSKSSDNTLQNAASRETSFITLNYKMMDGLYSSKDTWVHQKSNSRPQSIESSRQIAQPQSLKSKIRRRSWIMTMCATALIKNAPPVSKGSTCRHRSNMVGAAVPENVLCYKLCPQTQSLQNAHVKEKGLQGSNINYDTRLYAKTEPLQNGTHKNLHTQSIYPVPESFASKCDRKRLNKDSWAYDNMEVF